ncbi:hypothetical protein CC86DRAFT_411344 [Ophiobolus disseminans]|uniref:Uncharacterized protein n=1 Tax=Ophiobolus disseminans TaxID=1469910 RepID=A0A6A6ZJ24_9PLEO|nr:hypothetical protein CC86DRAFT_411344 [Ophiobolus disseminans]
MADGKKCQKLVRGYPHLQSAVVEKSKRNERLRAVDDADERKSGRAAEEREQNTVTEIQSLVSQNGEMRRLIEDCSADVQDLAHVLMRIKTNLGIDRDIGAEIEIAIEDCNIPICRRLAEDGLAKLPCELRNLGYEQLVPDEVIILQSLPIVGRHTHNSAMTMTVSRIAFSNHVPWTIIFALSISGAMKLSASTWLGSC